MASGDGFRLLHSMLKPRVNGERRVGASRLSTWSGRRVAAFWLLWPAGILLLCAIAVLLSIHINAGFDEVRVDLTRRNLTGLAVTLLIPPACLTWLWWRMRGRRQSHGADRRRR